MAKQRHTRATPWVVAGLGLIILASACAAAGEPAAKSWEVPATTGWKVKPTSDLYALSKTFFRKDYDDSGWEDADVAGGHSPYTDRYVFCRRWIDIPAAWKGEKITAVFGGVADDCTVYVNGRAVGEHSGRNEAFDLDITAAVRPGEKNLLAVFCSASAGECGIAKPVSVALADELAKARAAQDAARQAEQAARLDLKNIPDRLVYETYVDHNWEVFSVKADGSDPINLTKTPNVHELYPHVSPDGTKVCFVVDEGSPPRLRSVYYMNIDGSGRTKVADNAREGCWNGDGTAIAYLKGEFEKFTYEDYATKGLAVYDLKTAAHTDHVHRGLEHLYNLCWSPDGNWFVATVHGGMGFKHAILAFEARGYRVFNLEIPGCRPDLSPDGKRIVWGASDWEICVADIDFSGEKPLVKKRRTIVKSAEPMKVYHADWSPDGKRIAFSRGPEIKTLGHAPEMIGIKAKGWNLAVADAAAANVWMDITTDGNCNKEPDWAPVPKTGGK